MNQSIIIYPDPKVRLISANVRFFNEELNSWIADMRDTMAANNLDALSAILIGIQYNIILLKEGDGYKPYINSRIIRHAESAPAIERSLYYPGITAEIDRYNSISVVYENENGESEAREFNGEDARMFQQQLDHCFGSTFVDRCSREVKQQINDYLEFGLVADPSGGECPTVFYRDYFKRAAKILLGAVVLSFAAPFAVSAKILHTVYIADIIALVLIPLLIVSYAVYALYESKKYKQCTSCQSGNIIGTSAILFFQLAIVSLGVFFWVAQ